MTSSGLRRAVMRQFGRPTGGLGRLAGWIMANRPSNRVRNLQTVEWLDVQPGDRVLEIGFGPGLALEALAARTGPGLVFGIDHSELMVRLAARRNADALTAGRMALCLGTIEAVPVPAEGFHRAMGVNTHLFWPHPVETLARVARWLRPGGRIALTIQPRNAGATDEDALRQGERIAEHLRAAGFVDLETRVLPLKPVNAVCVLGRLA